MVKYLVLILSCVALCSASADIAPPRQLVQITPDVAPVDVKYDPSLGPAVNIAADDPRVKKQAPGCSLPEQVTLRKFALKGLTIDSLGYSN